MAMQLINELQSNFRREIEPKELKKFGLVIGGILVVAGAYPPGEIVPLLFYPGILLLFLAASWPTSLRTLYRAWMGLGTILGFFVSRIILVALYYCIILPIGLSLRLFGHDPMGTRTHTNDGTYWVKHTNA